MRGGPDFRNLPPELNALSGKAIDAAYKVHTVLGPGLLESVYEQCLRHELLRRGVPCRSQVSMPIHYDGIVIDSGYRIDLIAADTLIIELKAVDSLHPIHSAQLLTYLKLTGLRLGLLVNFNVPLLRDGLRRIVL